MTLIAFTRNHTDLSTDKGYQFKFDCDRCGNGYMTSFSPSVIGIAGSVLRAAGSVFGGGLSSMGYGAYEMQRAVGGPAHDAAFKDAVEECKKHFCQCSKCGHWVCPEVCWNGQAGQCEGCAPDFQQEMVSAHAHAKAEAAQAQMRAAAQEQDYVGGIDMGANAFYRAPQPNYAPGAAAGASPAPVAYGNVQGDPYRNPTAPAPGYAPQAAAPVAAPSPALPCAVCQRATVGTKFCEDCGTPRAVGCARCNQPLRAGAKFCGTCGARCDG